MAGYFSGVNFVSLGGIKRRWAAVFDEVKGFLKLCFRERCLENERGFQEIVSREVECTFFEWNKGI